MKPFVKLLLDFGPLLAFFAIYGMSDLITATLFLIPATILVSVIYYIMLKKWEPLPLMTMGIVTVMGGLTLWLGDEDFIKMKPTIINAILGLTLIVASIRKKMWLQKLLGSALALNERGWQLLTRNYGLLFLFLAIANELIWRTQSTDVWVNFKVFGILGVTFLFFIIQVPLLKKYIVEEAPKAE